MAIQRLFVLLSLKTTTTRKQIHIQRSALGQELQAGQVNGLGTGLLATFTSC